MIGVAHTQYGLLTVLEDELAQVDTYDSTYVTALINVTESAYIYSRMSRKEGHWQLRLSIS